MKSSHLHIPRWVATLVVLAALIGGGALALGLRDWSGHEVFGASNLQLTLAKSVEPVSLGNFTNGFAAVLKPALPAIVNIHTSKVVKTGRTQMPFFNDPMFRQFFGNQFGDQFGSEAPRAEREHSLGSGVIVTSDGTILTNNHVVDGATDVKVDLSDKREFQAKVIGHDAKTDIAVLKIEATNLPVLPIGDSSKVHVGDVVFAIGEPYGLTSTATMGIVSATGRGGDLGIENYEDFIQTDAAINPGNSGGAMIDLHGNLIGINTAILAENGGNQGIGFAIPINMARSVMDQLVAHGKVVRGYLGLFPQDVTPALAKQFGLSQPTGALVAEVEADTPASRAGLKRGDVILAVNGQDVTSANELRLRISQTPPGTNVKLQISRDGKTQDVNVALGELPEKAEKTGPAEGENGGLEGVETQNLTPDIAEQLQLQPGTHGVVVTSVDPASQAAAAGLQRGDVIQEVNHKPVSSIEDYRRAVSAAGKGSILLLVNQQGVTNYLVIESQ